MQEIVKVEKKDEIYMRIICDRGILKELNDHFAFYANNYKFHPKFQAKVWDGRIRIFNALKQELYIGLLNDLIEFCEDRDYKIEYNYSDFASTEFSLKEATDFVSEVVKEVTIPNFQVRPYQVESFAECIREGRALLLSPTSSGKSFMIYLLYKYYQLPMLLIVDGTGPVHQMYDDLVSYGCNPNDIHKIYGGQEKNVKNPIVISTWQSVAKEGVKFFSRFGLIVGDEAHHFQAKSFMDMMNKTPNNKYKFGFTGTIDDTESECNPRILTGLFGKIINVVTTSELIEQGYISDLKINCIIFQYSNEEKKKVFKKSYNDEMNFICSNPNRNNFIKNLVISKMNEGENLILFYNYVDKHGKILYDLIRNATDKPVFFIHGGVKGEERNKLRAIFEQTQGACIVASFGTFQTAISINNIHNLIFGSPFKSKIRNLQSIGRGLRKHHSKTHVTLFDLSDNLIVGAWKNHTIKHFAEFRLKQYDNENFNYKFYNIKLGDKK